MSELLFDNEVEFELSSNVIDPIIIEEPRNWQTDEKTFERASQGGGTLLKLNNVFEMGEDAVNYIESVFFFEGFNTTIYLTKRGKDNTKSDEEWRTFYRKKLEYSSFKFKENFRKKRVEASFAQGGLFDKILTRYNDEYDLVNTKSADSKEISELETIIEQVTGIDFFRRSELFVEDLTQTEMIFSGGDRDTAAAIPFEVEINSDRDHLSGTQSGINSVPYANDTYAKGQVGSLLYFEAPIDLTLVLKGKVKLRMLDTEDGLMKLELVYYKTINNELVFQERKELAQMDTGVNLNELEYDFNDEQIVLEQGESLALVSYVRVDGGIGQEKIVFDYLDTKLTVKLDFKYPPTQAKNILPFEMFDRLLEKITGEKGLLISNILGRPDLGYNEYGEWSTLAITSGFYARGFDIGEPVIDANGDITPKKQFVISFSKAFSSFDTVVPLYWGIEERNGKEYVRIEDYDFTQQPFTGVRLGRTLRNEFIYLEAQNPERISLQGEVYTKLEIGFNEGGSGYEEVFGLSSPHGIALRNTCIKEWEENTYQRKSEIRADLEGYELARIKQSSFNPDEDTNYDQKLFFRHLKKVENSWVLRKWQDDFNVEPKNIYSPGTSGNLLLTPLKCLMRHQKIFSTALYYEPSGSITFISSNCNSDLELDGEKENKTILNSDLEKPYINGFSISFGGKIFQETVDELEGYRIYNGQLIPKWFGIVEFKLNGRIQQGKLIKTTVSGDSKHEIALI